MAAAFPSEPSWKDCSICHELFTEPKLLPCGHIVCKHCLLSWLNSQDSAKCPLCQDPITNLVLQKHISFEDAVERLPTDLSMVRLVEAERVFQKGHQCCVCEDVAATSVCLSCEDFFCVPCKKVHSKQRATKHHQVEDLGSLTPERLTAVGRYSTCNTHPDKACDLFCSSHLKPLCLVCATTQHRSCPEVKGLEEKVKEAEAVLEKLVARLDAGKKAMGQSIERLDQQLQESEKKAQAMLREIDETCDRLKSSIEACRHRLKELVLKVCSDKKDGVCEGKTHLLHQTGKFTCHKIIAERVQKMISLDDKTTMSAVMWTRVDDLDSSFTLPDIKGISIATLVIDPNTVASLEKGLAELGEVKLTPLHMTSTGKLQPEFQFHENHGTDIELTNNQKTAYRTSKSYNGIVISSAPMVRNTLFEVQVNEVDRRWSSVATCVGVVTQTPDTVTLPKWSWHLPSAAVVHPGAVRINTVRTETKAASALRGVKAGSRIGVMVDTDSFLHVVVDGQDVGRVTPDRPLSPDSPVHAMFDLVTYLKKVTTLKLRDWTP